MFKKIAVVFVFLVAFFLGNIKQINAQVNWPDYYYHTMLSGYYLMPYFINENGDKIDDPVYDYGDKIYTHMYFSVTGDYDLTLYFNGSAITVPPSFGRIIYYEKDGLYNDRAGQTSTWEWGTARNIEFDVKRLADVILGRHMLIYNLSGPPPEISISAQPMTVHLGQPITLSYTVSNATACTAFSSEDAGDWGGPKDYTDGTHVSEPIFPTTKGYKTYSIRCFNPKGGPNSARVEVWVEDKKPIAEIIDPTGWPKIYFGQNLTFVGKGYALPGDPIKNYRWYATKFGYMTKEYDQTHPYSDPSVSMSFLGKVPFNYILHFMVESESGLWSDEDTLYVTVDDDPPTYFCGGTLSGTECLNDNIDVPPNLNWEEVTNCTDSRKCEYYQDYECADSCLLPDDCGKFKDKICTKNGIPQGDDSSCGGCANVFCGSCDSTPSTSDGWKETTP